MVNLQNSRVDGIGDNRHILVDYDWEDDYQDAELTIYVEKILREWDKLMGGRAYDDMFDKEDAKLYDFLRMKALDLSFRLKGVVEYSENFQKIFDEDEELKQLVMDLKTIDSNNLNDFRFKSLKTRNDLEQKSKQIQQKLIEKRNEEIDKAEKVGKWVFDDMIIPIEIRYKINVDPEITCSKYISYINRIKKENG